MFTLPEHECDPFRQLGSNNGTLSTGINGSKTELVQWGSTEQNYRISHPKTVQEEGWLADWSESMNVSEVGQPGERGQRGPLMSNKRYGFSS